MTVVIVLAVAGLMGLGVWLLLDDDVMRVVLGTTLITHAAIVLLVAPRPSGEAPLIVDGATAPVSDPIPQALSLTAIVIAFAVTALLLALAGRVWADRDADAGDAVDAAVADPASPAAPEPTADGEEPSEEPAVPRAHGGPTVEVSA